MIVNTSQLHSIRAEFPDESIALRFGCYDLLHAGHQDGIDFAASHADLLVIGVMPDRYVRRMKGPDRPINPQEHRVEAIDQADGVDFSVIVQPRTLALTGLFLNLRPDVYVEDVEYGASRLKTAFLRSIGTEYVIHRPNRVVSTSDMIASLGLAEATARSSLAYAPQ